MQRKPEYNESYLAPKFAQHRKVMLSTKGKNVTIQYVIEPLQKKHFQKTPNTGTECTCMITLLPTAGRNLKTQQM